MRTYKKYRFLGILSLLLAVTNLAYGADSSTSNTHPTNAGKQAVYTKQAPAPIGAYSQAIKRGSTIYISGQIPIDNKTGKLVAGDFSTQFKQAIINLSAIAKSAGGNLDDIVKVTIYVTNLANFQTVNQVMAEYFHQPYPARAVIEVKALPMQAPVEIEAIMEI